MKLILDKAYLVKEKKKLARFKFSIMNFNKLLNLINSTIKVIDIRNISNSTILYIFAKNILSIEISRLNYLQLTIVDLLNFIHLENQS
jgi:hypothetical protein